MLLKKDASCMSVDYDENRDTHSHSVGFTLS